MKGVEKRMEGGRRTTSKINKKKQDMRQQNSKKVRNKKN